jgi:predicted transcriptional regulator
MELIALTLSVISIAISIWTAFSATSTLKANMLSLITSLELQLNRKMFNKKRRLKYIEEYLPDQLESQKNGIETLESSKEMLNAIYESAKKTWWPAFFVEKTRHSIESVTQTLESAEWHEEEIDKALERLIEKKKELGEKTKELENLKK